MSNRMTTHVAWIRTNSVWLYWIGATLCTLLTVFSARLTVHVPFTPVPITLQVFAVLLTGLLFGWRVAFVAQAQYLLLGMVGLPVFAGGASAPALIGVTGGYLLSYPVAAAVVSRVARPDGERRATRERQLLGCLAGIAVIYLFGCSWLALATNGSFFAALLQGALVFIAWDLVKAAVAVMVARLLTERANPMR